MASLLRNKHASHHYEILDTLTAGVVLHGFEVKSLRQGNASLKGAYVVYRDTEAYLVGMYIAPYQPNNTPDSYDPYRKRKLLLKKSELDRLAKEKRSAGLTAIPLSVYTTPHHKIKVEVGIARGKKIHDKRATIRKREDERSMERTLKNNR